MRTLEIITIIRVAISEEMGIPLTEIEDNDSFFDLGLDSVTCIFVMERLEKKTSLTLTPIAFWDYPTIETFASYMEGLNTKQS